MRKQYQFVTTQLLNLVGQKFTIPIPRQLYLFGIRLHFRGNYQITTAFTTPTGMPDGMVNLLNRIRLRITHEIFGAEVPLDMSGPALNLYRQFYKQTPMRNNTSLPIQNNVTNWNFDFMVDYIVPPENIFPADQEFYLLDLPRTSLAELDIEWGNPQNVIDGTAGVVALGAFGTAGVGSPSVDVEVIQVLDKEDLPLTALVRRFTFEQDLSGTPFPVTNDKIRDLPLGESVRSYMIRQYTRSTVAGQTTALALTYLDPVNPEVDAGITRVGVRVNEKYIKQARSWQNLKEQNRDQHRVIHPPIGTAMLEYVEDGNIDRVLFTQDFVEKRSRLDLAGSVVTATNARAEITQTSIRPNPRLS
jgi:hypothetical protein